MKRGMEPFLVRVYMKNYSIPFHSQPYKDTIVYIMHCQSKWDQNIIPARQTNNY